MGRPGVEGETLLVTGASSGIGLEFSRQLAAMSPARLIMVSNQDAELQKYSAEIKEAHPSVDVRTLNLDLTAEDCARQVCNYLDREGLEVDLLINNAGIFSFRPVVDTPYKEIACFIDLHVRAMTALCYEIGARMKARGSGRILNMSSMSCWMPMPGLAMYSSTKAYIRTFSRALHYELRDYGVSVTVACPGGIATDLFGLPENLKRLAVNIKAIDTPQSFVRKAIAKALDGKQQYINGGINRLAIVFIGMMPRSVRMLVKHKLLDKGIVR